MDFYELLGVDRTAAKDEIRRAYFEMQKICHPDVAGEEGEEVCILLNDAYDVLADEERREAYDEQLAKQNEGVALVRQVDEVDYSLKPQWEPVCGNDEGIDPCADDAWEKIFKTRDEVWQGEKKPVYTGRPLSRSNWEHVDEDSRGDKWQEQLFTYVDPFSCINCYQCCDCAPSTFYIDSFYGKARVHTQWGDDEESTDYAVASCPVDCIHWVSREELQRLEHVTADSLFESGGQMELTCPDKLDFDSNYSVKDPFELSDRFEAEVTKCLRQRKDAEDKAGSSLNEVRAKIQKISRRLSEGNS